MRKNILICGLSGSGKSTLVDGIAEKFRLKALHSSKLFREMQKLDSKSEGWWENKGMQFSQMRLSNLSMDKAFDKKLLEMSGKGGFVIDSWTMPWLMDRKKTITVWLECSLEARAKRVAKRNRQSFEEVLEGIKKKEDLSKRIYWQAYGIKIAEDMKPFDMVLNVESLNEKQALEIISAFVKVMLKKK